jgi:excisionase family DNA binding protein
MVDRLLYRPSEVGEALGICRSKAYELIASGEIPSIRIGGCVRVPVDKLREWIERKGIDRTETVSDTTTVASLPTTEEAFGLRQVPVALDRAKTPSVSGCGHVPLVRGQAAPDSKMGR